MRLFKKGRNCLKLKSTCKTDVTLKMTDEYLNKNKFCTEILCLK